MYFHTNTLKVLEKPVVLQGKLVFEKGMILFCMRHLNLIGVFDMEKNQLLWSWGWKDLDNPHSPTFLENGHLVYNNLSDCLSIPINRLW